MTIEDYNISIKCADALAKSGAMRDRREIMERLEGNPTLAGFASAAAKLEKIDNADLPPVRLAILRNFTIEHAIPYIKVKCFQAGLNPFVFLGPFDNFEQEVFVDSSQVYGFKPDIIVVALRLHALAPELVFRFLELSTDRIRSTIDQIVDRVRRIAGEIRRRSSAIIVFHNFELCMVSVNGILEGRSIHSQQEAIHHLNTQIIKTASEFDGAYVLDFEHVLAGVGYNVGVDDRYWHIGRSPYAPVTLKALASYYVRYCRALKGKGKKCLVLDCDNTLWGGVVGEEGIDGIMIGDSHPGSAFVEFQAAILDLHRRGILLAICSKNNEVDVLEVLSTHPSCLLKREHFASMRINWQDKCANIREIATELNIGIDSIVFLDDSAFECRWVRENLPDVTVIQLPEDPTRYRRLLQSLDLFDTLTLSREDSRRGEMYAAEMHRQHLRQSANSMGEFLGSLMMKLTIRPADSSSISRIAKLTQKTNQFNLTTRRYTESDIIRMQKDPAIRILFASLEDRFGSSGIIAVAIVYDHKERRHLDTFLMSCRVIGRGVEDALLAHIVDDSRKGSAARLTAEYFQTPKNAMVRDFLQERGFVQQGEASEQWQLDLSGSGGPKKPDWFVKIVADTTA